MSRHFISCSHFTRRAALAFVLPLLFAASIARSQDAVRPSLAGEAASEARRQDVDRIPYNLLMGPVRFRVGATIGAEYNDNINLSDVNEQEDVIIRPQINFNAIWPVTQINTLRLDLGIGYAWYIDHSDANTNTILITPDSQLAFDIFVGDFRINIHDRISIQQDPIAQLALNDVVDYGRLENYAGVSLLWDLNKILVTLGYDHYNYVSTTDRFEYLDRSAEILSGTVSLAATSTLSIGGEGNVIFTNYDQSILNDSEAYSAGAFLETQLTNNAKVRLAGGYQWIDFDRATVNFFGFTLFADKKDLEDFYVNILFAHRLNAAIKHTLAAGHESQLGINSNYIVLNYVRHTISWNIVRNTLLSTEVFYEDADDSGGFIDEHLHRYGGALTVGYQLTPHVTLGARYQYTQKDSDVPLRDYCQNRISIDGTYSF